MPVEIAKDITWVGIIDWALKHFHGHELSTPSGSTYNAFIIQDEKTAVVDTVWSPFTAEFLEKVQKVIDPSTIDYVVVNHGEPDHSGALPELMKLCPDATVVVSRKGEDSVAGHYHHDWKTRVVRTGDTLNLGKRELTFVEAPMLHWPDTMFTYVAPDGILMPNDAFGQHFATGFRFNDQVDREKLYYEAMRYYANIITPYSRQVIKMIDEFLALNLPVNMILPSHGVMWRDDPMQIVHTYREWAQQKPQPRALVMYDSMWQATRHMAEAIAEGLFEEGVEHRVFHLAVADRNEVLTEIFRSHALVIGSPTLNNGILPTVSPLLEDLKGLRFRNKIGAAFGSYGWGGEAVKRIEEHLENARIPLITPGVRAKWQPDGEALAACKALGKQVAEAVKKGGVEADMAATRG
jgi:flavorubredoxin